MLNIFDTQFNGMPHSEMYRSWVDPSLFQPQPKCKLENWSEDDVLAYCGPRESADLRRNRTAVPSGPKEVNRG